MSDWEYNYRPRNLQSIECWFGFHKYCPSYFTRVRKIRGVGSIKEFRYTCWCCKQSTMWMPWNMKEKFDKKQKPRWSV